LSVPKDGLIVTFYINVVVDPSVIVACIKTGAFIKILNMNIALNDRQLTSDVSNVIVAIFTAVPNSFFNGAPVL
jgi:hypothetical protein